MNKTLNQIVAEQKKIVEDRTAEWLRPLREDAELGKSMPFSVCDSCGREDQPCKRYPINSQSNAILCQLCFIKEENALRMNYKSDQTVDWYLLKWYK